MKTVYKAYDGKEFDNEDKCKEYEELILKCPDDLLCIELDTNLFTYFSDCSDSDVLVYKTHNKADKDRIINWAKYVVTTNNSSDWEPTVDVDTNLSGNYIVVWFSPAYDNVHIFSFENYKKHVMDFCSNIMNNLTERENNREGIDK